VYFRSCSPDFPVLTLDSGPYLEGWYSAIVFESRAHLARCGSSQYCWCRFLSSWKHEVRFNVFPSVPYDLFARCLLFFTFYTACDGYFVAINSAILMIWDEECNLPYFCLSSFLHFSVTFSFVGPMFCYQIPSSVEYASLKPASNNSFEEHMELKVRTSYDGWSYRKAGYHCREMIDSKILNCFLFLWPSSNFVRHRNCMLVKGFHPWHEREILE